MKALRQSQEERSGTHLRRSKVEIHGSLLLRLEMILDGHRRSLGPSDAPRARLK